MSECAAARVVKQLLLSAGAGSLPHSEEVFAFAERQFAWVHGLWDARLGTSTVGLPVREAVADTDGVGVLRMCFDMMPVHGSACSLTHRNQMGDQLQQRPCRHAQASPSVAFVQVGTDACQGSLAV